MAATFNLESVSDLWSELLPLAELHRQEIAHFTDIPLGVDRDGYERLQALGLLRVFTVRMEQTLIGYCVCVVRANPHYLSSFQAHEDVIYVSPKYRGLGLGARFLQFIDARLKLEGVQVVYRHVKDKHDHGPMLKRMGYELIDHIYGRRLDVPAPADASAKEDVWQR